MIPKTRLGKRSPFGSLVSETGKTDITMATVGGQLGIGKVKGHADLKFGGEPSGVLIQLDISNQPPSCLSSSWPASQAFGKSASINIPKSHRNRMEVDMDELMAAMVLSSLSCSPLPLPPQSSAHREAAAPSKSSVGGIELSDSGSSGYWSIGLAPGSPASTSPPPPPDSGTATPPDDGLDMELDQVLFEDPAPRKRRNSLKMAYKCLWPSCEKVLTSVVGIKRHIKTTHLCHGSEHEEDFYYTEINQHQSPPASPPSPSSPPSPPPPSPPSPPAFTCSTLSRSVPSSTSSSWQVQTEHSYQALPLNHVVSLAAPPTTCSRQGMTFRVRSVSVGEQWLQNHSAPCSRRIRSEAKKCRKVYGIEHRELWCTACRWKKACQRFQD
ncbi:zinc finger protein 395 isoform X2 [Austrofundulus limnaeus]|uniref:Zinc finger protein 395 isoform X2 n=1 Tax=Austrofundulus limnaeus TaxID=52670 RepID=A0A2I4DBR3_AUSLI|nr:PREDICTED: zinc finger protein 395-like isoform X2 [Austrofundulus limnaeus]